MGSHPGRVPARIVPGKEAETAGEGEAAVPGGPGAVAESHAEAAAAAPEEGEGVVEWDLPVHPDPT